MAAITMEQPKYLSRGGDLNTRLNSPQILVPVSDGQEISNEDLDYEEIDDIDSDGSYHSEGDDIAEYWDPYLYQLQQQAPKPEKVICQGSIVSKPSFYGDEYHGSITREETAKLLGQEDGRYLVRKGLSQSGTYSLSFVYKGCVRHYHLHYENGEHFVGDTSFEYMEDLVTDGLITLYMEDHNVEEYLRTARESTEVRRSMIVPGLETIPENRMDENLENRDMPPPLPPRSYRNTCSTLICEEGEMEGRISPGGGIYTNVTFNTTNETTTGNNKDSLYTDSYHYEKPHNFKIHTFYSMPWCDYCKNFLWGLRSQGFKCKDCGYISHKQCKDSAPSDCKPTRQRVKRVYGVDLTTVVKMYGTKIPLIVKECIEEIEKRGVDLDGIYRVPGKAVEILQIKKMFDEEMHGDFTNFEDLHAIAGALKLYFRELPIPLITFDNYDLALIAARCSTIEETMETVKVILSRLPLAHYNSLRVLIKHLHKVQEHKLKNRMDSKNLAVIFAPSIMRPPTNQDQLLAMMKLPEQKKITDILISNYSILFR